MRRRWAFIFEYVISIGSRVGTVGWQEAEPGDAAFEDLAGLVALVDGPVVEDDDIVRLERGGEWGFDVDLENLARHGAVDDAAPHTFPCQ